MLSCKPDLGDFSPAASQLNGNACPCGVGGGRLRKLGRDWCRQAFLKPDETGEIRHCSCCQHEVHSGASGRFPDSLRFLVSGPAGEEERVGIYNIVTRLQFLLEFFGLP